MYALTSLIGGLVFGTGLIVSGMANPAKVLGFLDLAGKWDPSLALVMAGAVTISLCAFLLAGRRRLSYLGAPMQIPSVRHIDRRLLFGSLIFGLGWGLVGFCPGPALVSLGSGHSKALVFVAAMLTGMMLFEQIEKARARRAKVRQASGTTYSASFIDH